MRNGVSAAVLAALLVAGCNQLGMGGNNSSNAAAPTSGGNAVAPAGNDMTGNATTSDAGNALASAGSTALTRDYVVGRWSVTGNCAEPGFSFNPDGTVSRGDRTYQWRVEGNNLVVARDGAEPESTPVRVVDQQNMIVTSNEGPIPLVRC